METELVCSDWLFNPSILETLPEELTKRRRGKPSIVSQHPEVIDKIKEIISQNSSAAHSRRRDDIEHSFGVSLSQLKAAVKRDCGVTMSKDTIHRTMVAPNKGRQAAKQYTGKVKAKIPCKSNTLTTKDHADFRFTCVQVNHVNEMAALFEDEVLPLSCDDKNKLNIGTPAVSRQSRYQSFFDNNNKPNLPDHDFPHPNSKLTPGGYLFLTGANGDRRSRSLSPPRPSYRTRGRSASPSTRRERQSPQITLDASGRKHVVWPRGGPLNIILHSDKYFPSTSQMHLNQLLRLLPDKLRTTKKTVVTIICDGGPDWRTDSPGNILNYGRIWRDLSLDAFILTSYSPYHSRYNPVERGFSPLTKWLAGVIFPICLPGESTPPQQQSQLPQSEKDRKEKEVHDRAMDLCSMIWSGREWAGFPIHASYVPCDGSTQKYNDHDELRRLTKAPNYSLKDDLKDVTMEYRFIARHLTRKTYQLEYVKCTDKTCQHCCSRPVKATKVMTYLEKHGGTMPTPSPSASHPGHYRTFLETLVDRPHGPRCITENLPSNKTRLQSCSKDVNCRYISSSKTDARRHNKLVHLSLDS